MFKQIQDATGGDLDFKKKHKLSSKSENGEDVPEQSEFKREYKSSRDALSEFSPFQWSKQW